MYSPGVFSLTITRRGNCEKLSNMNMEIFSTVRYELLDNRLAYEPSEDNWRRIKQVNYLAVFVSIVLQ